MENIHFYWFIIRQRIKHFIIKKHFWIYPENVKELIVKNNNNQGIKITCKWCKASEYLSTEKIKKIRL